MLTAKYLQTQKNLRANNVSAELLTIYSVFFKTGSSSSNGKICCFYFVMHASMESIGFSYHLSDKLRHFIGHLPNRISETIMGRLNEENDLCCPLVQ